MGAPGRTNPVGSPALPPSSRLALGKSPQHFLLLISDEGQSCDGDPVKSSELRVSCRVQGLAQSQGRINGGDRKDQEEKGREAVTVTCAGIRRRAWFLPSQSRHSI